MNDCSHSLQNNPCFEKIFLPLYESMHATFTYKETKYERSSKNKLKDVAPKK